MVDSMLIAATPDGVHICECSSGDWQPVVQGLPGKQVSSVMARAGVILAGASDGIYRSDDLGRTWRENSRGLEHRHVRWMAHAPAGAGRDFAGTEPAEIYASTEGGEYWQPRPQVAALRERYRWYLPYSPRAGCIRGFTFHGQRAYAAAEVGGVLVSQDGGASWELVEGSLGDPHRSPAGYVHPDVHSVEVHPSSPDCIFAATGGGFYRSTNGGRTWELLYRCYCRSAWIDPADAGHILLGPADTVDRNGRIEQSRDGGQSWQPAADGLAVPWPRHMVERFYPAGDELLAVLSNGELLAAPLQTLAWRPILAGVGPVNAVARLAA